MMTSFCSGLLEEVGLARKGLAKIAVAAASNALRGRKIIGLWGRSQERRGSGEGNKI